MSAAQDILDQAHSLPQSSRSRLSPACTPSGSARSCRPPFVGEDVGEVDDDGRIAVIYAFAGQLPEA
ncbi:MAG: hypothetical protein E6J90_05640 [Deltaproteobacteria bacterium]|nr:MAG: hypothetical protein E6J90_05640 [Deltaproteobacteria bacterium]